MNNLPSARFRTQYAKLTEPTVVTVNGHPIGIWTPRQSIDPNLYRTGVVKGTVERSHEALAKLPAGGVQARQAQRDALLSKINRGK